MQGLNRAIQVFKEENLFSKEDVIRSFKLYMEFIQDGEEEDTTDSIRAL